MMFNVLTHPWVPLDVGGTTKLAAYADILCGESDSDDLRHPRDDLRFFARMLLSALTQALFPARDTTELQRRIDEPLPRQRVEKRIQEVSCDFELIGDNPFMQDAGTAGEKNCTGQLFFDIPVGTKHVLFRPVGVADGLCPSCALLAMYGLQAFATQGGRGYSPGVRGAPPVTTLVRVGSVRKSMWANTLSCAKMEALGYPADEKQPWCSARHEQSGDTVGLVQGLFWQPRSLVFHEVGEGHCASCGHVGSRLAAFSIAKKSKVTGGFFRHPFSPAFEATGATAKQPWSPVHVPANRPIWTGLADMLAVVRADAATTSSKSISHAAPVVEQWVSDLGYRRASLAILEYHSKKTKICGRVSEEYELSIQLGRDFESEVRFLVDAAQDVLGCMLKALREAYSNRKRGNGGFFQEDARAEFWRATEPSFWAAFLRIGDGGEVDEYLRGLRLVALALFDLHTGTSSLDNSKQALVAQARRRLCRHLYKRFAPVAPCRGES